MSDTITIKLSEYRHLLKRDNLLETAEGHGVDNWCGWGDWHAEEAYEEEELTYEQYNKHIDTFYADGTTHGKSHLQDITVFHETFGIKPMPSPTSEDWHLRFRLLSEEWNEYCDEHHILKQEPTNKNAQVQLLDAMVDMMYIIEGTSQLLGWDLQGAWEEVQRSNMSKLDDEGKPIRNGIDCALDETRPHGKILKSNNFKEPELERYIK